MFRVNWLSYSPDGIRETLMPDIFLAGLFISLVLVPTIGLIRGTFSTGVLLLLLLGLVVPFVSLLALVVVIVKPSKATLEMRDALKRLTKTSDLPPSPEELEFQQHKAEFQKSQQKRMINTML